ncbi:MAG: Uma2 family endonuclease [Tepidisphaeraceae bacterium]
MTADELFALGDDFHGELRRGKVLTMSPAGSEHGDIALAIGSRIRVFVDDNNLGCAYAAETGFVLSRNPDTVRAPDVGFVTLARLQSQQNSSKFFDGAPDLAVEVLSPSNTHVEMMDKVADYLNAGTRLVWIINPTRKSVTVYDATQQDPQVLRSTDTLQGGDLLPGFSLPISKLFR